jgi:predicted DCC family thiol-disulfide oxidoreductase YuxK
MIQHPPRAPEKLLLLYDGECNLCLATVEKLRRIRTQAKLTMLPLQEADPVLLPKGIQREDLLEELHVVDGEGRLYKGAEAVIRIMRTVPGLAWLAGLYRVPGMKGPAQSVYRFIAKHRYRLFGKKTDACSSGACMLPNQNAKQQQQRQDSGKKGEPS